MSPTASRSVSSIMPICLTVLFTFHVFSGDGKAIDHHSGSENSRDDLPTYQTPDQEIIDILEAPDLPQISTGSNDEWILLKQRPNMLELAEIARPRLHIAGYRINPETNGRALARTPKFEQLIFYHTETEQQISVDVPGDATIDNVSWSPDGERIIFTHTTTDAYELWTTAAGEADAYRLTDGRLNATDGNPCNWLSDEELVCEFVPPGRGEAPDRPEVPEGPVVQESGDEPAPVRTFQDLLDTPHEADLFEYYFTAQLKFVNADNGDKNAFGSPAIFDKLHPAPDRKHFFVSRTVRPFSFLVPDRWRINDWFPREMEIWNRDGEVVNEIASLPLAEEVPVDSMRTGPRDIHWQPGEDAALMWTEVETEQEEISERIFRMDSPEDEPQELFTLEDFYWDTQWHGDKALITEVDRYPYRAAAWQRTWIVPADGAEPRLLWDHSAEVRAEDPGSPLGGRSITSAEDGRIFVRGTDFGDDGAFSYIDLMDLETEERERMWKDESDMVESPEHIIGANRDRLVTMRESETEHPNYFITDWDEDQTQQVTQVEDPAPQLQDVQRKELRYDREDGVSLAAYLYLPPDFEEGDELPAVMWAYPREFSDPDAADQLPGGGNRFTRISGYSHLFFLLQGYAVIDNASMAIIGGELGYPDEPNDTYVEQLVMSAEAAIDAAAETGYVDPERVGVGGHSYGGFMTTNLLAHSDRFAAGIARSAAHNRTLTPFGFQNEQRTLWEAQEVYTGMSPFMYAHQIEDPVLMIHGADDPNPGTFPMQSERMFHALKGMGKPARLVMLEHEDHGYGARESIYHTLVEMFNWFDEHVKGE